MDSKISQFLILNIGEHYFAANVANIQDVIRRGKTTPVPLSKSNIRGLLNLRGHIVTEIDVAYTLGITNQTQNDTSGFTVVITVDDEFYSLAFDGIGDVIGIAPSQIEPLPETVQKKWHSVAKGVHRLPEHLLVLLDLNILIDMISDKEDEQSEQMI